MRIKLLFFLLLTGLPLSVTAAWTGIAAFVGKSESNWLQLAQLKQADIDFLGLRIEEKTAENLRVGVTTGRFDLRLFDPLNVALAEKYDGQFLSLYLRWPVRLTEHIKFHTRVSYQYNLGNRSVDTDDSEISWNEVTVNAGLSVQLGLLALRPFVSYRSIDGDISSISSTSIFKQEETASAGLLLDYFVERSAFVRLQLSSGANQTMRLSFSREY